MSHQSKRAGQQLANAVLEKKLTKYMLAGGAVLAAPLMSHADAITYSGAIDEIATTSNPVFVSFPGGPQFELQLSTNGPFSTASVLGTSVTFLEDTDGDPKAFNFGSLITGVPGDAGELLGTGPIDFPEPRIGYKGGNWPQDGTPAYLGFAFTASDQSYTGWAQIAVDLNLNPGIITSQGTGEQGLAGSATLTGYAFTTGSITAGQTVGSAPEPSSLALFAIGGAAALALLRRRRAAAQSN
jgi:hypothetical protein